MPEDTDVQTPSDVEVATPPLEEVETTEVKPPEPDKLAELEARLKSDFDAKLEEKDKHWQSVKDREVKAARRDFGQERRARQTAESQLFAIQDVALKDPRMAAQIRAAQTTAKARAFEEQGARDQQEQNTREFYSILEEGLSDDGIDPEDKRIDWGMDAPDPIQAMRRFNASVSKIKKESAKGVEGKRNQEMQDLEVRLRKELGLDSADKIAPSGAGYGTGGLKNVLGGAKNTREAKQRLDEFIKGE